MKRYCKNIDLTDRKFISAAVRDCLKDKMGRRDVLELFQEYSAVPYTMIRFLAKHKEYQMLDGIIETIIDGIIEEIRNKHYIIKPIRYTYKIDGCSGKKRRIGIQNIKQQLYDYIAVYALKELFQKKIGYYQCSALEGKGQLFGALALKKWIKNHNIRWAWQSDVRKYYESIDKNILKAMLRRDVDNEDILHLVFFLIDTFEDGLSIGSYLSQFLANYYLSRAYHFTNENLFKIRKKRNGQEVRVNLVSKVLFFMDDVIFLGTSLKDLKMAEKKYRKFVSTELNVEVKEESRYIDLSKDYIDMMGYKISRKNLTMRASNFRRLRKGFKKVDRLNRAERPIPVKLASTVISRSGPLKHTDTKRFKNRTKADDLTMLCRQVVSRHDKEANNAENAI